LKHSQQLVLELDFTLTRKSSLQIIKYVLFLDTFDCGVCAGVYDAVSNKEDN